MLYQGTIYFNREPLPRKKIRSTDKSGLKRYVEQIKSDELKKQQETTEGVRKREDLVVEIKDKTDQQKFDKILNNSSDPLLHIKTHLPLELEPKEIIIDITKVSIITKPFLGTKEVLSVSIENISDVTVESIPLFATLRIHDSGDQTGGGVYVVKFLKKEEAIMAQRVIQGLLISKKNEVDLAWVEQEGLLQKLEELGKVE